MKLFAAILFLASMALAKEKHAHREHGAHAHGAGSLGIVFEGASGHIEFKIPSESIFGFEHETKSDKDKKKKNEALAKLENKFFAMLVLDSALNCKVSKSKIEVIAESNKHSDVVADYKVTCDKSPIGTEITFNFQKQFPKIKDLNVQIVLDNLQKSTAVTKNGARLLLQ